MGGTPRPLASVSALLVDADADTREIYAQALKLASFTVEESAEGREALAKALATHHDVVIMETRLPGLDGYQLCTLLRQDPSTRSIPIVVVTGEAHPADVDRARRSGADIVLVKPCVPEALLAAVCRAMDATDPDLSRLPAFDHESNAQPPASRRRLAKSRAYGRGQTTEPPREPPVLMCPTCDRPLAYEWSYVGGVSASNPEQWDLFECPAGCGSFQYRQRTRQLRRI